MGVPIEGYGVEQDLDEAVRIFRLDATENAVYIRKMMWPLLLVKAEAEACLLLEQLYSKKFRGMIDDQVSNVVQMVRHIANNGVSEGRYLLGLIYSEGLVREGINKNQWRCFAMSSHGLLLR